MTSWYENSTQLSDIIGIFSAVGCTAQNGDSIIIGEAAKMKSHILTCLGALLEHQNIKKAFNQDDSLFFNGVMSICSAVSGKFSNDGKSFSYPFTTLADSDFTIGVACRKICISGSVEPIPGPIDAPNPDSAIDDSLYWAAILQNVDTVTFDNLFGRNIASVAALTDKVTVAHIASATKHNNIHLLERIRLTFPNFAGLRDEFGRHALHYAAKYTESAEMLRYLIEADPSVLTIQDSDGNTPLHVLAGRRDDDAVLESLLQCMLSFPPSGESLLLVQNSKGLTPLHIASKRMAPDDVFFRSSISYNLKTNYGVIQQLLSTCPGALAMNSPDDTLVIIDLVANDYDVSNVKAGQDTISLMISEYEALSQSEDENYFLLTDPKGRTILNALCESSFIGSKALKQAFLACPEAAAVPNEEDVYPLANLLENYCCGDDEFGEIVFLVLDACPGAANSSIDSAEAGPDTYPLHLAAGQCSQAVVRAIYEAYPAAISRHSEEGGTPLCHALVSGDDSMAEFVLSLYPGAIRVVSAEDGRLPFQFAVKESSLAVVEQFYTFHKLAIKTPDSSGFLPLHTLSVVGNVRESMTEKTGKLRFLLKHYPEAATIKNRAGDTPYEIAVVTGQPAYFLRRFLRLMPHLHPLELRRFNYAERRGAMYLLFAANFPANSEKSIWMLLRSLGEAHDLQKAIIAFL